MPRSAPSPTALGIVALALLAVTTSAQAPRSLAPEEYGRWELLVPQRAPLSPDGRWLVYGVRRADRQDQLRVQPATGGDAVTLSFGEQPAFSDDSRWLACLIGMSEAHEAKLRRDRKPIHKSLGLVELATGAVQTIDDVESFAFSGSGTHLAFRRYPPEPANGTAAPSAGAEEVASGSALVVRELATGRDTVFGSVSEMAWQDRGARLAFVVTVDGGVGNGVQLFDAGSGSLRVLDSSSSTYSGLAWRKDAAALAVLRSRSSEERDGPTQVMLAWADVTTSPLSARILDTAAAGGLGSDLRLVRFRAPRWSEDGSLIFVGVGPWLPKPARPAPDGQGRRLAATSDNPDEQPDVQVWHPADTTVMPRQKLDARRERERSMLAAFHVDDGRFVRIAERLGEEATPIRHQRRALVVDTTAFAMERSIGRAFANAWTIDLETGARSQPLTRIEDRYLQASPGGCYLLYRRADHYWSRDLATGQERNLTATLKTSFVDVESDETGPTKPMFGVAGWTRDDHAVLLYDKHDIWEVKPDGGGAVRLTNGAAADVRYRYVRLDPDEEFIDRSRPLFVSAFGLRSKKAGYARIAPGPPAADSVTALLWLDKRVTALARATKADVYAYSVMGFDDSPDYFVGDASLTGAAQVTRTNPFMSEYAWGRSAVVDYRSAQGVALQAALFYPANYDPSKKYPMVVYMYEKLSDGVHQFSMPSERDYYNAAAFTTRGYVYLQPDIVFRPRDPGLSVIDAVVPAVQKIVQIGLADPKRVGIIGHSWGGFDSAFLATHTEVFAAAVAGAPITDLVSNYGNHHWSSGIAETDHIETGQQRMAVPLYDDLQAYIRNSAVFTAHTMKTPLLVEVGDSDGTVFWHQGVELYNIARRAGKPVVLLQYGGEDHGLRKRANQIDYHHRIFEWFDHYLTGAPAPAWITSGERFIDRERDLQQRKLPAKPAAPAATVSTQPDRRP